MSEKGTPIYIVLSADNMTAAQTSELNRWTEELGRELQNQSDHVQSVEYVRQDQVSLPPGAKVAGELLFAQQLFLQLVPIVTPWVLQKIDSFIKSRPFSASGKQMKATVLHSTGQVQITPQTTKSELASHKHDLAVAERLAPGRRLALVIGNSKYQNERLPELNSATHDADRLAAVLEDPRIGAFAVEKLINQTSEVIKQSIERFFHDKEREDLLLLYFSGHGIKLGAKQLFLAAQNTMHDVLRATGVEANFITETMEASYSQRKILILDCCYGGAIAKGAKAAMVGQSIDSVALLQQSGFGSVIIAGSEAMQYAFDGQNVQGYVENSVFTDKLIRGLQTGEADTDQDGLVEVNELYQYAYKHVKSKQTPNISIPKQTGQLFIGRNPRPVFRAASLPEDIQQALRSEDRIARKGAVTELAELLENHDPSMVLAAEQALERITMDNREILEIHQAARRALDKHRGSSLPTPPSSPLAPSPRPAPPAPTQGRVPAAPTRESSKGSVPTASNKPLVTIILLILFLCTLLSVFMSLSGYSPVF